MKAIWIDLDNSPHVPLFLPVIEAYRKAGVDVVVTARRHSQTIELLENAGLAGTFETIGIHYGANKLNKIRGLLVRAWQLARFIRRKRAEGVEIGVAISHGSRSQVIAAPLLGIPSIAMYDYEHNETYLFNNFATKVMTPAGISFEVLEKKGLPRDKHVSYKGLKEELYVNRFVPDPDFWTNFKRERGLEIPDDKIVVALRPPATTANYHNEHSDVMLVELLKHFLGRDDVFTIIVPRTGDQRDEIAHLMEKLGLEASRCHFIERAVSGLDLAVAADLLVSGGGTMNREAVLLGTPVYSIFAGKLGSLDAAMERDGQLTFIRQPGEVAKIRLEKKNSAARAPLDDRVEAAVKAQIDAFS